MKRFNKIIFALLLVISSVVLPAGVLNDSKTAYAAESTAPDLVVSPISNQNSNMTIQTSPNVTTKIYIDEQMVYSQLVTDSNPFEIEFSLIGPSRLAAGSVVKVTSTNAENIMTEKQVIVTNRAELTVTLAKVYDWSTSITGKTEPYAKVSYELGSRDYDETTADSNGKFTFELNKETVATASSIWIHVRATDGLEINNKSFSIIDTKKPEITFNKISNKTTTVKGTTPGDRDIKIKLYINGKEKYSTKSNASGNYSMKIAQQKAGTELKLTATDSTGNKTTKKITVADKIAPTTPTVNKVYKTSKKVTGKAEKKSTVYVYKGKKYLGKAKVNSKGKFTVKIAQQKAGSKLKVYAKDQAKNKSKSKMVTVKK